VHLTEPYAALTLRVGSLLAGINGNACILADGQAELGDAQAYFRIGRLWRFTEVFVGMRFRLEKSLCAAPSESETRQPARFAKKPVASTGAGEGT
jgi:hypothetical protein